MESERCVFCLRTHELLMWVSSVTACDLEGIDTWHTNPAALGFKVKVSVEKLFPLHWVQPVEWVLRNSLMLFCFSSLSPYYYNCFWAAKSWQINCEQINTALFVFMIGFWLCVTLPSFHWLRCVCTRRLLSISRIFFNLVIYVVQIKMKTCYVFWASVPV